ncbi:MAG: hypothetical protein WD135_04575 [Ferruginibacter sp.]
MYIKLLLLILITTSCTKVIKTNKENSFYIKYHTVDSLLHNDLILVSRNKVSFYDSASKLFRLIPANYKTNDFLDMHYFFTEDQFPPVIEDGIILYNIQIKEGPRYDSTSFSVKKMIYTKKHWKPKSDMGWINVYFPEFKRAQDERKRKKLADYIIHTIAKDSYTIQ